MMPNLMKTPSNHSDYPSICIATCWKPLKTSCAHNFFIKHSWHPVHNGFHIPHKHTRLSNTSVNMHTCIFRVNCETDLIWQTQLLLHLCLLFVPSGLDERNIRQTLCRFAPWRPSCPEIYCNKDTDDLMFQTDFTSVWCGR